MTDADETRLCHECGGRSKPVVLTAIERLVRIRCPICQTTDEIPQRTEGLHD